jgi:hypothetical protein
MGWAQRTNDARRGGRANWPNLKRASEVRAMSLAQIGAAIEERLGTGKEHPLPKMKRGAYKRFRQRLAREVA